MIAAVGDTPYNIVLVLHILAAMIAFAPLFVHPVIVGQAKGMGEEGRRTLLGYVVINGRRIYGPALLLAGLLGFGLSGMSDQVYSLGDGWLIGSIVVWIAMNGVLHAVVVPGERALADGDDGGQTRADIGGAAISVLLVVMLYLMVFKPGA